MSDNIKQKTFLLDYLDGSAKIPDHQSYNNHKLYKFILSFSKYFKSPSIEGDKISTKIDILPNKKLTLQSACFTSDDLRKIFYKDETTRLLVLGYKLFNESAKKVYVVSKVVTDVLSRNRVEGIKAKDLPENFCAYLEFNSDIRDDDNDKLICSFITIMRCDGIKILLINSMLEDHKAHQIITNHVYYNFPDEEALIEDVMLKGTSTVYGAGGAVVDTRGGKYSTCTQLLLSTLLYIDNRREDLKEILNFCGSPTFSNSNKGFTKRDFILVTRNFNDKQRYVDSTIVSSFWRRQPCGIGRQDRKLIFIEEFERKYKQKG